MTDPNKARIYIYTPAATVGKSKDADTSNHTQSPVAPATGRTKKVYAGNKVQAGLLFLTANTHKRVPVFREHVAARIFFQELDFYRSSYGFKLHGYVLMPDHFHLLLNFPEENSFANFLRDFKSSVGKLIVDWAKRANRKALLQRLRLPDNPKRYKDARYRVLQPNSHVRLIMSISMFQQKLDYIHANPVRGNLVKWAIDYRYTSLRNYELGRGAVRIDPHNLLLS